MQQLVVAIVLSMFGAAVVSGADRPEGRAFATRSMTLARHGMVAAAHPLAVQIGVDGLKRGGTAVDAAVAINAALALMEPVSCGLSGDLFALVWDPKAHALHGLDGSGRAPRALSIDQVPAEKDGYDPTVHSVRVDRARMRRRLVHFARPLRPPPHRGASRADDSVCT